MDELEARIHRTAASIDVADPIAPEEVMGRAPARTGGAARRAFLVVATVLVVVVLGAGILALRHGSDLSVTPADRITTPGPSTIPALRARLELPGTVLEAGSWMTGEVVIHNETGEEVVAGSCLQLYWSHLANDTYAQPGVMNQCFTRFVIPPGESRFPVTIDAIAGGCSIPCTVQPGQLPIPAGTYEVITISPDDALPTPEPVTIEVRGADPAPG